LPSSGDHLHGRLGDGPWFGQDNFDAIVHSCSPSRPKHGRAIRYGLTGQCGPAAETRQPPVVSTVLDCRLSGARSSSGDRPHTHPRPGRRDLRMYTEDTCEPVLGFPASPARLVSAAGWRSPAHAFRSRFLSAIESADSAHSMTGTGGLPQSAARARPPARRRATPSLTHRHAPTPAPPPARPPQKSLSPNSAFRRS